VDVLDLSVRCQSHSLSTISNIDWTSPTTLSVAQLSTSPPRWSNCVVNHGAHYDLEPVSPSSSPGSQPSSCVVRRDLDAFHPRRSSEHASQQSPTAVGRWSTDAPVVTTSTAQPASSAPRVWNGDGGVPYSPLKRVLHQYRSSVAVEENSATQTIDDCAGTTNGSEVASPPPTTLSTAASTTGTCRRPTTTTVGMSFEEFVLGMLSKVGGGKAITAATQSYLRESAAAAAAAASNRGGGGAGPMTEARSTAVDAGQTHGVVAQRPRYDERSPYETDVRRQQMERQVLATAIHSDEYGPSSYHPAPMGVSLPYPPARPTSDLRLIAPPVQPSMAAAMRRPPTRAEERDDAYRERRRKNNEAAKRSRDTRRLKELQVAAQAERLTEENLQLKAEIAVLRSQLSYLHRMMLDNNNVSHAVDEARADDHHSNPGHQHPPEDADRTI